MKDKYVCEIDIHLVVPRDLWSICLHVPNVPVGTSNVSNVFVCIGMGARAWDRHIPKVPTQTCRHTREKMAVVAVSLATIPNSICKLPVNTETWLWRYYHSTKKWKSISWSTKNYHRVWMHFGLTIFTYTCVNFLPQGGALHHQWMLKTTPCWRKCSANKPETGSGHDRRHIMTSPGYTGISHRDMQASVPYGRYWGHWFL